MTQDYVTVKQYIEQLAISFRKADLAKRSSKAQKEIESLFNPDALDFLKKFQQKEYNEKSLKDLLKYQAECGVKAYNARLADIEEKGPVFLSNVYRVRDKQGIFIISVGEYVNEYLLNPKRNYGSINDNMSDESGQIDTYKLTE